MKIENPNEINRLRFVFIVFMTYLNSIASFLDTLGGGEGILDG